jgi:hypothetical protein
MCWFMCDWVVIKGSCDDISRAGNVKHSVYIYIYIYIYIAQLELIPIENLIIHSLKLPF